MLPPRRPLLANMGDADDILITGIKVVDLLAPYARGGKIGLFGGAGVGKTVVRVCAPRLLAAPRRRARALTPPPPSRPSPATPPRLSWS